MYAHIMVFKNAWQNDFENMLWRCFYKQSVNEKQNHSFNQMFFYECWEKKTQLFKLWAAVGAVHVSRP